MTLADDETRPQGSPGASPDAPVSVSLVVVTQRRQGPLACALRSLLSQTGLGGAAVELVVVDNDAQPSVRGLVEGLAAGAPFPVRYVHEPASGVASARNAGVEQSRGALIAFLDDDEEAPGGWLLALMEAQQAFDADAVFGPVRALLTDEIVRHRAYLTEFFSRTGPQRAGPMDGHHGCGNSLIRRSALPDARRPFSPISNLTGGEDTLLFGAMQQAGARFCWAPGAWVWEHPAAERLNLGYAVRRAFVMGQGPTSFCAAQTPPNVIGVARWMIIGLAQAAIFGLIAAGKWLLRAPDLAQTLDRAARGLGKALWWGPFKINFYGRTREALDHDER
ncbi:MAG: glycosyltransferase [Caulobacterales bacterium]